MNKNTTGAKNDETTIRFMPFPYQSQAMKHMLAQSRSLVFLGMGLGKTVSALSVLKKRMDKGQVKKSLVLAPLRVAQSVWPDEVKKWNHLSDLRVATILGTPAKRRKALAEDADIYVMNHDNVAWLVNELDGEWPFDLVIVDEISMYRNPDTKKYRALAQVAFDSKYFIGLTGTPTPKGMSNLWAQVYLVDGGVRLGDNYNEFLDALFYPCGPADSNIIYSWKPKRGSIKYILGQIRDVCLSIKTPESLIPESRKIVRTLTLPPKVMLQYYRLEDELLVETEDATVEACNSQVLTGKLGQFANGALYTGKPNDDYTVVHDEKLEELKDLITTANGEPILCFYQYKHDAARIQKAFPQARLVTEPNIIDAWNRGEVPLMLAHPASAGHGLNLQFGGSIIVWWGLNWNLELYEQANARLSRIGQKNIVRIYHLISSGTIDEVYLPVLNGRALSQNYVMDALTQNVQKRKAKTKGKK